MRKAVCSAHAHVNTVDTLLSVLAVLAPSTKRESRTAQSRSFVPKLTSGSKVVEIDC